MNIPGRLGLDWRISLMHECWFYFRTLKNWRQATFARLYGTPLNKFECRTGQVIIFPDRSGVQMFQEIWWRQIYTIRYPRKRHAPHLILDIGANIGVFSLFAVRKWPRASVLAFEPDAENARLFERNVQLSKALQICLRPIAIAGTSGQRAFYRKSESGWHSLYGDGAQFSVEVPTLTLDDVLDQTDNKQIDLLKLDCEGGEYEILSTREQLLSGHVGFVAMEYHEVGGHSVRELAKVFDAAGFTVQLIPEPRWQTGKLYATNKMTF